MRKISVFILLCAAIFLCITGCQKSETGDISDSLSKPVHKFAESLLSNAYSDAISIYNDEIAGNSGSEQEAADYMASFLEEIESGILSGAYSESDAKAKMATVKNVYSKINCEIDGYESLVESVDQALASKVAYKSGIALFEQKNYKDALVELEKVLPDDSDYADAAEKYFTAVENYKNEIKSSAETSTSDGDFLTAIDAYKQAVEILPEDSDLHAWLNTCEKEYISGVISDAEKAFSDYTKYEDALKIIQAALQYYPDDPSLIEAREKYGLFAPMNLYDMAAVKGETSTCETDTDTYKQEYTKCFWIGYGDWGIWSGETDITFDLKGIYNNFSATIYGRSTKTEADHYSVIIYGDGKKLYENLDIVDNGKAFDISADVTGVSDLTIVMKHSTYSGPVTSGIGISNMILQRTVK